MNTGYVYKLWSSQTDEIYIGSTKQKYMSTRLSGHRGNFKNGTLKCSSIKIVQYDDCKIEALEVVKFDNIVELRSKEGEWIRKLACVNKSIPGRTSKEYYIDNKEHINEMTLRYREKHREEYREYQREYQREHQSEYQRDYRENNKKYFQEYYQNNKEYFQEYRKNNQKKNKENYKQIVTCICGCNLTKNNLSTHLKSNKHLKMLELIIPQNEN